MPQTYYLPSFIKRVFINNQIRAKEVRLIDETGKQLGIVIFEEALKLAREKNLDLIQVTEKVMPPVCKIGDYGKYLYHQQKKEKSVKQKGGEVKGIRISFGISDHDLEVRVKQAEKFLKEGDIIKIEMRLKGREKALQGFARGKFEKFVEMLSKITPVKVERDIRREARGLMMIVAKQ